MMTNTLLWRTILNNPRLHPFSLGLLYLYCPAAVYWWRAGVEIQPPFDPIWQAVEDYQATPPRTLREYLEIRGLGSLIDHVRLYIEHVRAARNREKHVVAPELLPTFLGARLPFDARFGIQEELQAIGGEQGFFAYVRTWAFLIPDWKREILFQNIRLEMIWAAVNIPSLRRAYRLPAWAFFPQKEDEDQGKEHDTPYVLGIPPMPSTGKLNALATLYHLAQSAGKYPWDRAPQVVRLSITGEAKPDDPILPASQVAEALFWTGERSMHIKNPLPVGALTRPEQCAHCPFQVWCLDEKNRQLSPKLAEVFAGVHS